MQWNSSLSAGYMPSTFTAVHTNTVNWTEPNRNGDKIAQIQKEEPERAREKKAGQPSTFAIIIISHKKLHWIQQQYQQQQKQQQQQKNLQ